jgi:hypothetical protein
VNPASHSHDRLVGSTVPSELRKDVVYRVERRLGDGATATAFVATRFGPEGTSPVVLKIIQPSVVAHAGDKARIAVQKEAVALGRLNERVPPCPFIVRLLDTGSVRFPLVNDVMELPWLALEYVHGGPEGTTLEDRVRHSIGTSKVGFGPGDPRGGRDPPRSEPEQRALLWQRRFGDVQDLRLRCGAAARDGRNVRRGRHRHAGVHRA